MCRLSLVGLEDLECHALGPSDILEEILEKGEERCRSEICQGCVYVLVCVLKRGVGANRGLWQRKYASLDRKGTFSLNTYVQTIPSTVCDSVLQCVAVRCIMLQCLEASGLFDTK